MGAGLSWRHTGSLLPLSEESGNSIFWIYHLLGACRGNRGAGGLVANRLGHSDPSVTLRVYAHVLRESSSGVADIFARAVERSAVSKSVSKTGPEDDEARWSSL